MMRRAEENGATIVTPLTSISDEDGTVAYGSLRSYGDVVMTFIQRDGYTGPFLPGYRRITSDDPINSLAPVPMMVQFDHVVGS
jgi:4-hydroxyphenylpyruvate dioxygenase